MISSVHLRFYFCSRLTLHEPSSYSSPISSESGAGHTSKCDSGLADKVFSFDQLPTLPNIVKHASQ